MKRNEMATPPRVPRPKPATFSLADGYRPIPVAYQLRAAILRKVRSGQDPLPDIQGREATKRDVLRALLSGYNIYLISEEGTGKTRLAKSLARLLPPIPKIRGCPYNDDPKWPPRFLCPKCRDSKNPAKEYGLEILRGEERFSRIQGNDYTDESKLLGLKDIQAIVQGKSPADIRAFAATGAFRANRGILFIDELPAIRTKVQVLLHPICEEKKAILEEYHWEHPLDNVLIATGNPQGYSHINEVPRPLLDRLELIYMPLPDKEVEREIMLQERFRLRKDYFHEDGDVAATIPTIQTEEFDREVVLPWWTLVLLNEAIDFSRKSCSLLDRKPSIRGSYRALDHTYASAELANRRVPGLEDACHGLRLALRGRVELRPDLIDFDHPEQTFQRTDELSEDLLWNALENTKALFLGDGDREKLAREIGSLKTVGLEGLSDRLSQASALRRAVEILGKLAKEKVDRNLLNEKERQWISGAELSREYSEQYDRSAVEVIANAALHQGWIAETDLPEGIFVPRLISWAPKRV